MSFAALPEDTVRIVADHLTIGELHPLMLTCNRLNTLCQRQCAHVPKLVPHFCLSLKTDVFQVILTAQSPTAGLHVAVSAGQAAYSSEVDIAKQKNFLMDFFFRYCETGAKGDDLTSSVQSRMARSLQLQRDRSYLFTALKKVRPYVKSAVLHDVVYGPKWDEQRVDATRGSQELHLLLPGSTEWLVVQKRVAIKDMLSVQPRLRDCAPSFCWC
eukprot:TRINITY_DN74786_c0_g1_i1.p1 TRINITY_DN74786_c0_g1~~TRINITY_DN74786_c0_g1_i1.p1  ORF type:complete len:214 (-),score=11.37 TRINITY_DN74786_c0_g1_i1:91-732(-)